LLESQAIPGRKICKEAIFSLADKSACEKISSARRSLQISNLKAAVSLKAKLGLAGTEPPIFNWQICGFARGKTWFGKSKI